MILSIESDLWEIFTDPQWIGIFITAGGVITTALYTARNFAKQTKTTSADLTYKLNERLYQPNIFATREIVRTAIDKKQPLVIGTSIVSDINTLTVSEHDLDNYLAELELIGLLLNKRVLDLDFTYQTFGYLFVSIFSQPEINKYIKYWQSQQSDLWSEFETAVKKFKKHKQKKGVK